MNGDRPTANGERILNGVQQNTSNSALHVGQMKDWREPQDFSVPGDGRSSNHATSDLHPTPALNGDFGHDAVNGVEEAPQEILQLIPKDHYLPMAALVSRASQSCWNGLSTLVEGLAAIQIPEQASDQTKFLPNNVPTNQTKANLDKKERLLRFANDQKADFVKLLVLLQWSKDVEEVGKTISINYWLMKRRQAYWDTIASIALLKQESAGFQMPNPDLRVAAEVLSRGSVSQFPTLGYLPQKELTPKQILRLLKSLNQALSVRLALSDSLPPQLGRFHVHDGRATFTVPHEFELDVSVLDESLDSPFRMVDFRFCFSPAPRIPDTLLAEIERYTNANIDKDGLQGAYLFLHELTLSYKLAELHKQALELSRAQWSGNISVELIRRNFAVQYWCERQVGKSWIEVGIASGRERKKTTGLDSLPFLEIKWMRQGKRVDSVQLFMNESLLCFEDVLRQVMALHSTQILDAIYDKLVSTPLFAEGELTLEQSVSDEDPEACSLMMQLSKSSHVQVKIDPVTGLFVISPVSERSERLQYEINRIQGVADEIVSKLLNFRCSIVEAAVLASVSGTRWESLRAFKLSQAETKALFAGPVVRMNLFRQFQWGRGFSLAITHGQNSDQWWLLQQMSVAGPKSQSRFQILSKQRIEVQEELSPAYFERLATYATGLISLQRNADFLQERKEKFNLAAFPGFERNYELPELSFDLDMANPVSFGNVQPSTGSSTIETTKTSMARPGAMQKTIKVRFGGIDRATHLGLTIAQFHNRLSPAVLKTLDKSMLGSDVMLDVKKRLVTIRVKSAISEAAIPAIVDKAMDLEKNLSTIEQIHRLPGLRLQTLSNSTFTIIYRQDGPKELGLMITFGRGTQVTQLEFFPRVVNPHVLLTAQYSKLFMAPRGAFATKVRDFLTSLTITLPLLDFLHNLQHTRGLNVQKPQSRSAEDNEDLLRVHVLVRSATAFAIQYFTPAAQVPHDVGPDSQPHLLARLEILQHINASRKPMWLIRAALEDFQSYSRPSYSTPALRAKLRQEVFARADGRLKWLALDTAAACMADEPEPLLQSMHDLLGSWVKQSTKPEAADKVSKVKGEPTQGNTNSLPNGTNKPKPSAKAQGPNNVGPNAGGKAQRPPNASAGKPAGRGAANASKNKQIITLD